MYDRFPEVFEGRSVIEAKSTVVIRCILSMQHELLQLAKNNPKLIFNTDASQHDMYYMNMQDSVLYKQRYSKKTQQAYRDFCAKYAIHKPAMGKMFNDSVYFNSEVDAYELNKAIFKIASSVQGTEMRELFSLFDIYTPDGAHRHLTPEIGIKQYGRWKGEMRDGYRVISQRVYEYFPFSKAGKQRIEVRQATSQFNLEGIHAFGIDIQKADLDIEKMRNDRQ